MKKICLMIAIPLLLSGCINAYVLYKVTIDLDLTVVDAETGTPIPNAQGVMMNPEETTQLEGFGNTDAAGLLPVQTTIAQCRKESMGWQYRPTPEWTFLLKLSHPDYQDTSLVLESDEGKVMHSGTITMSSR